MPTHRRRVLSVFKFLFLSGSATATSIGGSSSTTAAGGRVESGDSGLTGLSGSAAGCAVAVLPEEDEDIPRTDVGAAPGPPDPPPPPLHRYPSW